MLCMPGGFGIPLWLSQRFGLMCFLIHPILNSQLRILRGIECECIGLPHTREDVARCVTNGQRTH